MAVVIRDFQYIPSNDEALNRTLQNLQNTLQDIKTAIVNIDARLTDIEEV